VHVFGFIIRIYHDARSPECQNEVEELPTPTPPKKLYTYKKVKWSRYRPAVARRLGRGIALLFHHRGTRRGWVVSSTSRPHFIPGKDPVPIVQEAGWAPGMVWMGRKSHPHRDSILDCPACSQSLYRLSYVAHTYIYIYMNDIPGGLSFSGLSHCLVCLNVSQHCHQSQLDNRGLY